MRLKKTHHFIAPVETIRWLATVGINRHTTGGTAGNTMTATARHFIAMLEDFIRGSQE
jgi:hypothetical protein